MKPGNPGSICSIPGLGVHRASLEWSSGQGGGKRETKAPRTFPLRDLRVARPWGAGSESESMRRSPDPSAEGVGRRRQPLLVFLEWTADAFRVKDV